MSDWLSPLGYSYAAAAAGFRKPGRNDLGLVLSDTPATAAALFTTNAFSAAPVMLGRELLAGGGRFRAVLFNAGQANACTGDKGLADCRETLRLTALELDIKAEEILPGSTGVIGAPLDLALWGRALPELARNLGRSGPEDFARAIMTTDRFPKIVRAEARLAGGVARLCGIAKGAGMICPNMATMLAVLLCDAGVEAGLWRRLTQEAVEHSFNRVTVDGDTSTNDTLYALANGASGIEIGVETAAAEVEALGAAMRETLGKLAYMLALDGEGATKVLHIKVAGALSSEDAEKAARAVGNSQLVKTAMYGRDANWGRIIAALGRSGARFNPTEVVLRLCGVELFRAGMPVSFDDDPVVAKALEGVDIEVALSLGGGPYSYELLASDLTHQYVDINAEYRS